MTQSTTFAAGTVVTKEWLNEVDTHIFDEQASVKQYGALGDGSTNDTTAIQDAIDAIYAAGGGTVYFPAGTYMVGPLWARNKVCLKGTFGSVIIKARNGVDVQILGNENQLAGTSVDYFEINGLIFDGNKANAPAAVASSAVAVNITSYFRARDCIFQNATGYGMAFQARPGASITGDQTKIHLENCYFLENGDGAGGDTYDGIDIKDCNIVTMIDCHAVNNVDRGINIRGERVTLIGCTASGNGAAPASSAGFEIVGNTDGQAVSTTCRLVSCESRTNGGAGFSFANGSGVGTSLVRVQVDACSSFGNVGNGLETSGTSSYTEINCSNLNISGNTGNGVELSATTRSAVFSNATITNNTLSGVMNNGVDVILSTCHIFGNDRYGIEETGAGTRSSISGGTILLTNTLGQILFGTSKRLAIDASVRDYQEGIGDIIPSAATITLPHTGNTFYITGTTNITNITASWRGRQVVLQFDDVLTVDEGAGNLGLAGDFTTSNADTLALTCDGTNWLEVSRSTN